MIILPEFDQNEEKIVCKICGESFKRLPQHLKAHGISYEDYLKSYEASKYSEYKEVNELADFLYQYYVVDNTQGKTILFYNRESHGVPVTSSRKYAITRAELESHVRGKMGIGLFFDKGGDQNKKTSLIAFDLDTTDAEVLKVTAEEIEETGVSKNSLLSSYSGRKGYHLEIFLNKGISHHAAKAYFDIIKKRVLERVPVEASKIEGRGFTEQGYKLPFGVHFGTGNRCQILNTDGTFVEDTFKILRSIEKQDRDTIFSTIAEEKAPFVVRENKAKKTKENLEGVRTYLKEGDLGLGLQVMYKNAPKLMLQGVHIEGVRNRSIFTVAVYLRDIKGYTQEQTVAYLSQWIKSTWNADIIEDHLENLEAVVESTFKYRKGLLSDKESRPQKLILSKSNIDNLITLETDSKGVLRKKSDKEKADFCLKTSNKYRRVLLSLIIQSKLFPSSDGYFALTYKKMQEYGVGVKYKAALKRMILDLHSWGYIEAVEFGEQESTFRNASNRYKLAEHIQPSVEKLDEQIGLVHSIDLSSANPFYHLYDLAVALLEDAERKRIVQGKAYADTKKRLSGDVSPSAETLEKQPETLEPVVDDSVNINLKAVVGGCTTDMRDMRDMRDIAQNLPRRGEVP